ncbi:hypothetical protein MKZ38_000730 [Zalerion maritima]|uniref:Uncharacterized protein n=1 Tax=Zalerion maritima TaxID=339359 RepID=A0AAD5RF36_9PEZI|nr:hypothetical protein MKZ38_000730 [Zalerion maritima]
MGLERFVVLEECQKACDEYNERYQNLLDERIRAEKAGKEAKKHTKNHHLNKKKQLQKTNSSDDGSSPTSSSTQTTHVTEPEGAPKKEKAPEPTEDDVLIKDMMENTLPTKHTGLPSHILRKIAAQGISDADIYSLRQLSHKTLRAFDAGNGELIKFRHSEGYESLKVHSYLHPWTQKALSHTEDLGEFRARLERARPLLRRLPSQACCTQLPGASRQPEHAHSPLGVRLRPPVDHLLAPAARRRTRKRICIGWTGQVRICRHLSISYRDIVENAAKLSTLPDKVKSFGCSAHAPDPHPGLELAGDEKAYCTPTAFLKQHSWKAATGKNAVLSPSERPEHVEPTLAIRWEAFLTLDVGAKDCSRGNLRSWPGKLSAEAHGNLLCPRLSLASEPGSGAEDHDDVGP